MKRTGILAAMLLALGDDSRRRAGRRRRLLCRQAGSHHRRRRRRLGLRHDRPHHRPPYRQAHSRQARRDRLEPARRRQRDDDEHALHQRRQGRHRDRRAVQRHTDHPDPVARPGPLRFRPSSAGSAAPTRRRRRPMRGTPRRSNRSRTSSRPSSWSAARRRAPRSTTIPPSPTCCSAPSSRSSTATRATPKIHLAMESGEVMGVAATSWSTLKFLIGDSITEKKVNMIGQWGLKKHPELAASAELARLRQDRRAEAGAAPVAGPARVRRSLFRAAGCAAARLNALRRAFDATMKDPAYIGREREGQARDQSADRRGGPGARQGGRRRRRRNRQDRRADAMAPPK